MSELLSNLASSFPAAAGASKRLRTYVEDIDRFLSVQQKHETPSRMSMVDSSTYDCAMDSEQTIPWDLLQNLPWDSPEWDFSEQMQLP
jgi:hypothetical protein